MSGRWQRGGGRQDFQANRDPWPPGDGNGRILVRPGSTLFDPSDGSLIDQVVLTRFIAPLSYTGEEMVEISCHGSPAVKQAILDWCSGSVYIQQRLVNSQNEPFSTVSWIWLRPKPSLDLIQAGARKASQAAASPAARRAFAANPRIFSGNDEPAGSGRVNFGVS